jgi:uncharacterized protein YegL
MTLHEKEDETEIDQVRLKDVRRSGSKVFGRAISRQTQAAVRRAEKERKFKQQHGPVKIIMKDGKLI